MTITDITDRVATPVASPPPSTPHPTLSVLRKAWTGYELATWHGAKALIRFPKLAALVVSAAVATPYLNAWTLGGVAAAGAVGLAATAESRVRLSSLSHLSRARKNLRRAKRKYPEAMRRARIGEARGRGEDKTWRAPRLRKTEINAGGVVEMTIDAGSLGLSLGQFKSAGDVLRSYFRAHHIDYELLSPGTIKMSLAMEQPFTRNILPASLPAPSSPLGIVVGLDSRGRAIESDMAMPVPVVIVGAQGAGKSSEAWARLWALQRAGIPFRVRAFDPKGGVELADLDGAAYQYQANPTAFGDFLESAWRALSARRVAMRAQGRRSHVPTEDEPLDVMVIDELLAVIALANAKQRIDVDGEKVPVMDAFMLYLSQARAAGFTVIALCQLGQKQVIGPLMDLFGWKTVLRVGSDDLVRAVGYDPKACPAHELQPGKRTAGIGYMLDDKGLPVMYRAAWCDDRERARIAKRMAPVTAKQLARAEWKQRQDKEAA